MIYENDALYMLYPYIIYLFIIKILKILLKSNIVIHVIYHILLINRFVYSVHFIFQKLYKNDNNSCFKIQVRCIKSLQMLLYENESYTIYFL